MERNILYRKAGNGHAVAENVQAYFYQPILKLAHQHIN